jgi:hypothetical protein
MVARFVIVHRRSILPWLLCPFLFFYAYNALRLGFVIGSPIHGIVFSLFFLAVAFVIAVPGRVAFLRGAACGFACERQARNQLCGRSHRRLRHRHRVSSTVDPWLGRSCSRRAYNRIGMWIPGRTSDISMAGGPPRFEAVPAYQRLVRAQMTTFVLSTKMDAVERCDTVRGGRLFRGENHFKG